MHFDWYANSLLCLTRSPYFLHRFSPKSQSHIMAIFSFFLFPLCFSQFLFTLTCLTSNLLPSPPLLSMVVLSICYTSSLLWRYFSFVCLFILSYHLWLKSSSLTSLFFFFLHYSLGIDILKLSIVLFSHCTFSYYPLGSPSLCLRLGCFACEGASKWT
jgi:hypothetical protein